MAARASEPGLQRGEPASIVRGSALHGFACVGAMLLSGGLFAACQDPDMGRDPGLEGDAAVGGSARAPLVAYERPIGPEPAPFSEYHVGELRSGDSLSTSTSRLGMNAVEVEAVVGSLRPIFDFRKARPGQSYELWRDPSGALSRFRYSADEETTVVAYRDPEGQWRGYREPVRVTTATVTVEGQVKDSLYLSMEAQGEGPWLTLTMVDMFSWDIDFFTETQEGDAFRIIAEKRFIGDRFLGYGRVLGAEYTMVSGRRHRAFRYELASKAVGYYDEDGKAVEKAFLKSPIKFASITSRYGLRRHPILKYVRQHRGVDYGAPKGTAVWALGDGVVTRAGWAGGYGRLVGIRHANGLETRYGHLSGFGSGIRAGVRVRQKQVIGYVGASGLATGPHLHFEVLRGSRHVNPLTIVAPPAPPIPVAERARFAAAIAPVLARLRGESPKTAALEP